MMERVPVRYRIALILAAAGLSSLGLGFSLERIFAQEFFLSLSLGLRFVPLLLAFLLVSSLLTVVFLTASGRVRAGGAVLSALAFGLPFLLPPDPIGIPLGFALLVIFVHAGSVFLLDYLSRRAVRIRAVFEAAMFAPAYSRFFQLFAFAVGLLVYFSAQLPPQARFTIPEEILTPSLNLIVSRVIEQVQGELGTAQFTEEEFIKRLEETGLLQVLEQQFGIVLDPSQIGTPQELTENLRQPLAEQLAQDLEDFLDPYLPFIPLAAALGAALSLLFLTPVFAWLAVGAFALVYRLLVWLKFARFETEMREVPVLKIS